MIPPPRRLSVYDSDYDPAVGARVSVLLDGESQDGRCLAYDVDAGTVTRYKLDDNGNFYEVGNEIARETVAGNIEVNWRA